MRFFLEIECEGSLLGDDNDTRGREIARILRKAAERIESNGYGVGVARGLIDLNGNTCGRFVFDADAE